MLGLFGRGSHGFAHRRNAAWKDYAGIWVDGAWQRRGAGRRRGDCDGDQKVDVGFASIQADPLGRTNAGEVFLVLGDGSIGGTIDTFGFDPNILRIIGDGNHEVCGAEIWIDDITNDGIAELIIGRQNYTPSAGREGAGALTILIGGSGLRQHAQTLSFWIFATRFLPISRH